MDVRAHPTAIDAAGIEFPAPPAGAPLPTLGDDLLWGVEAIAAELKLTRRQASWLLAKRSLPARKHLGKWVSSRPALRAHFANFLKAAPDQGAAA